MCLILQQARYTYEIKRQTIIVIYVQKVAATAALYSFPLAHPPKCVIYNRLSEQLFVFIIVLMKDN